MRCENDALKNSSKRQLEENQTLAENVAKKDQELQSISQKLSRYALNNIYFLKLFVFKFLLLDRMPRS
jgi:hypothetical protein